MTRKRKLPLIMIAGPDEEERALMRAILKLVGFDVIEAFDGPQAVKLAKERSPDLLVIDLTLPRLSGAGAIERIRKLDRFLPGQMTALARSKCLPL